VAALSGLVVSSDAGPGNFLGIQMESKWSPTTFERN